MKSRDIFDLVARTTGLIVTFYGLGRLLYALLGAIGQFGTTGMLATTTGSFDAVYGVVQVLAGLMVMCGIIPVADFAFPRETSQPDEGQTSDTQQKANDETNVA